MEYVESTIAALDGLFALTVAFVNCQEKRIIYLSYGHSTASEKWYYCTYLNY
jgi:hypothetical protein